MFDRPDLSSEADMTPEAIVADGFFSREEKLARLRDMKHELSRKAADGTASIDAVENRMTAINMAVSEVKREQAGDDTGQALGRMPNA